MCEKGEEREERERREAARFKFKTAECRERSHTHTLPFIDMELHNSLQPVRGNNNRLDWSAILSDTFPSPAHVNTQSFSCSQF